MKETDTVRQNKTREKQKKKESLRATHMHRDSHCTAGTLRGRYTEKEDAQGWDRGKQNGGRLANTQKKRHTEREGLRGRQRRKARGKGPGRRQQGPARLEGRGPSPEDPGVWAFLQPGD